MEAIKDIVNFFEFIIEINIMHKTKVIKYNNCEAEVDELLASLILTLWKNNIETWYCCQEEQYWDKEFAEFRQMANIQFGDVKESAKFMNLVVEKFKKFNDKFDVEEICPYPFYDWRYEIYPQYDKKLNTWFMITIFFPTSDINIINKVLNNKKLSKEELKKIKEDCNY